MVSRCKCSCLMACHNNNSHSGSTCRCVQYGYTDNCLVDWTWISTCTGCGYASPGGLWDMTVIGTGVSLNDELRFEAEWNEVWPLYRRLATFSSRLTTLSSDIGCSSMLSCPRCDRKYSVTYTLDRHMRYECGVEKQFCCAVCMKRFSRSDVLRAHQRKAGHLPVEAGWMGSLLAYNRK